MGIDDSTKVRLPLELSFLVLDSIFKKIFLRHMTYKQNVYLIFYYIWFFILNIYPMYTLISSFTDIMDTYIIFILPHNFIYDCRDF